MPTSRLAVNAKARSLISDPQCGGESDQYSMISAGGFVGRIFWAWITADIRPSAAGTNFTFPITFTQAMSAMPWSASGASMVTATGRASAAQQSMNMHELEFQFLAAAIRQVL